ncbi:hypothetical protein [Candidatus Arthromitus sp. SFB-rat-Yit]|uniref:hypothetical protein n=1 Tax=Candidatus Arthromitus sp. SFB-rat-Yit TaxID=1041504 RepID=UPI000227A6CC|nr:hypothetical protein [Candidatus Arthromitus sp. SFB-rat-Yit]BAK81098.1 hypothetical protein RATSFB_0536 [Candidatus Arthromitus sp. SFB-rat-Yit]
MKKLALPIICALISITIASCGSSNKNKDISNNNTVISNNENVQLPNPIVEYETLEEAVKACNFEFSVPDTIDGYEDKKYSVISTKTIQTIYYNKNSNANDNTLSIRKAFGTEDISGDYNNYKEINKLSLNNLEITTKGNNGKVSVATWTSGNHTFSITTNNPLDIEPLVEIINDVK